jgi:hypothetical protein
LRNTVTTPAEIELGQVAYEGYKTCSDGRSLVSGESLPDWWQLQPNIREAWRASADAVKMWLEMQARSVRN